MALGSRRRFLFRLVLYGLAFCVGLYVFVGNPTSMEGRLLGLMGIAMALLALYLLLARLQDPLGVIRYAMRPVRLVSQLIAQWHHDGPSHELELQPASLQEFLLTMLPDVGMEERSDDELKRTALALGEDLLIYVSPPLTKPDDIETLVEIVEKLRTPLHEESLLLVVASSPPPLVQAELKRSLQKVHLLTMAS